jgi:hypothetical protein
MHPDFVLEADRGRGGSLRSTRAGLVSPEELADRAADRAGARDLDQAVERMPGLRRQQRDRERAMPRDAAGPVPHPVMERKLPQPGTVRRPLSSRQRKARSVTKQSAQDSLPQVQYEGLRRLVTDPAHRRRLNDALSDAAGDVQQLPERERQEVQRLDRAIQAYEQQSDRGHVVYVNFEYPDAVAGAHPLGTAAEYFPAGSVMELDRFTGGSHCMHEVEPPAGARPMPVLEVQTRRGMYLGRSDSLDDTTHLLPRGLQLRVAGMHDASYRRPDGTTGRRPVIQVRDVTMT